MNPNCARNELLNDLLGLYCKTKVAAVENLLIKISAVESEDLSVWLLNNKRVRTLLGNPLVYDALVLLIDLKRRYPKGIKSNEISKEILFNPNPAQSTMMSFVNHLSDPEVQSMLTPFSDVLKASEFIMKNIEPVDVVGDLKIIKQQFEDNLKDIRDKTNKANRKLMEPKKSLSIMAQRREMFKSLLTMFENDVASAFEQSGLPEKAKQIRGGTLAKPAAYGVKEVVGKQSLQYQQTFMVTTMADYCWNNPSPKMTMYNHSLVQLNFLSRAGIMTDEDYYATKEEHAAKTNVNEFMDEEAEYYPHIDTGNRVSFDHKINPVYLYMLSRFFNEFQIKLKIPTGF